MAKAKSVFFCQNCGAESSKWMGRCPQCGEWNTLVEEIIKETKHSRTPSRGVGIKRTKPTAYQILKFRLLPVYLQPLVKLTAY